MPSCRYLATRLPVIGIAFAPDGKKAASVDETGALSVWEVPAGARLLHLPQQGGMNTCSLGDAEDVRMAAGSPLP
jgi:hypothetical protein